MKGGRGGGLRIGEGKQVGAKGRAREIQGLAATYLTNSSGVKSVWTKFLSA